MLAEELTVQECQDLAEQVPAGRLGSPEDVAALCVFLLSSGANYINGQVISVDGGWTA
jgi:3-oxoacyl-[acyl-carrier protein] reductase